MSLITICIPAFNAERFLEATLESVAAQTLADWDLVVTDDGSVDRTEEIVRRFASKVSQTVHYNRHSTNRGLPLTRNTGIDAAQGEWIAFIDSDDLWSPNHLASLVEASRSGDFDLVFSGTQPFDHVTGEYLQPCVPSPEDLKALPAALFSGRLSILPSSTMVRRRAFQLYGKIAPEFAHANDTEYWLRILRGGGRVTYTGSTTCLYRKHAGAMSLRAARILTNTAEICERYSDWKAIPRKLARERPANLYRYAARWNLAEDPGRAFELMKRSLRTNPFSIRSWLYLSLTAFVYIKKQIISRLENKSSKPARLEAR
jgi:glycosyltransferase involved in cell wall biosynthesis